MTNNKTEEANVIKIEASHSSGYSGQITVVATVVDHSIDEHSFMIRFSEPKATLTFRETTNLKETFTHCNGMSALKKFNDTCQERMKRNLTPKELFSRIVRGTKGEGGTLFDLDVVAEAFGGKYRIPFVAFNSSSRGSQKSAISRREDVLENLDELDTPAAPVAKLVKKGEKDKK